MLEVNLTKRNLHKEACILNLKKRLVVISNRFCPSQQHIIEAFQRLFMHSAFRFKEGRKLLPDLYVYFVSSLLW